MPKIFNPNVGLMVKTWSLQEYLAIWIWWMPENDMLDCMNQHHEFGVEELHWAVQNPQTLEPTEDL